MRLCDKVERILAKYPETRNSDNALFYKLCYEYHQDIVDGWGNINLKDLQRLPNYDSISRWRRSVQERGLYLPTDRKVAEKRKQKMSEWKKELGYAQPEHAIFADNAVKHLDNIMKETFGEKTTKQKLF